MIWALLCGCTPKAESEQTSGNMSLPELQTDKDSASDPAGSGPQDTQPEENNTDSQSTDSDPEASDAADQTAGSVSEYDETELETETDYVVDGGDGIGFGGN